MAWIALVDRASSRGELRAVYDALAARPIPSVYRPAHGDAPGIHRAHSPDPTMLRLVFGATGSLHLGDAVSWAERELASTVAARVDQCVY